MRYIGARSRRFLRRPACGGHACCSRAGRLRFFPTAANGRERTSESARARTSESSRFNARVSGAGRLIPTAANGRICEHKTSESARARNSECYTSRCNGQGAVACAAVEKPLLCYAARAERGECCWHNRVRSGQRMSQIRAHAPRPSTGVPAVVAVVLRPHTIISVPDTGSPPRPSTGVLVAS